MRAYLKAGKVRIDTLPIQSASVDISVRVLPPAEVFALRADLLRISPGYGSRKELVEAELQKALAADPGNPYALMQQKGSDAKPAVTAHPGDWRAWLVSSDRNDGNRGDIEHAAKLAPDDAGVLARLAIAEQRANDSEHALTHAVRAADLSPGRSDVLDVLAQVYAANARCGDAQTTEQRAIDALPDAAASSVPRFLLDRQIEIREHCGQAVSSVTSRSMREVNLKSCKKAAPRVTARSDLRVEFTLGEDGSPNGVKVLGEASKSVRVAVQRFVESCSYEPVVVDGKPQAVPTTLIVSPARK
jgi:hypothetical protein